MKLQSRFDCGTFLVAALIQSLVLTSCGQLENAARNSTSDGRESSEGRPAEGEVSFVFAPPTHGADLQLRSVAIPPRHNPDGPLAANWIELICQDVIGTEIETCPECCYAGPDTPTSSRALPPAPGGSVPDYISFTLEEYVGGAARSRIHSQPFSCGDKGAEVRLRDLSYNRSYRLEITYVSERAGRAYKGESRVFTYTDAVATPLAITMKETSADNIDVQIIFDDGDDPVDDDLSCIELETLQIACTMEYAPTLCKAEAKVGSEDFVFIKEGENPCVARFNIKRAACDLGVDLRPSDITCAPSSPPVDINERTIDQEG